MSRKSLKSVLSEIEKDVRKKDYVRNALSAQQTHIYLLDSDNLLKEILFDLRSRYRLSPTDKEIDGIRQACNWYVEELAKAFANNKFLKYSEGGRLKGGKLQTAVMPVKKGPGKYEIRMPSDGKNIFRRIKDIKRTYNRLLERKVARALNLDKSNFDSSGGDKSKGLIDVGHEIGSSIAETAGTLSLGSSLETIRTLAETEESVRIFLKKISPSLNNTTFEIYVTDEGRASNINTVLKGERGAVTAVANAVKELIETKNINWPRVQGSPSFKESAIEAIIAAGNKKTVQKPASVTSVSTKLTGKRKTTQSTASTPEMVIQDEAPTKNWAALLPIINAKLMAATVAQMGEPSLVNRTGRFASSAKVTGVSSTPQGYPSFAMSYDKQPYGVFDRRLGAAPWATPARDPYTIIELALRSILKEYAINRFYVRRT